MRNKKWNSFVRCIDFRPKYAPLNGSNPFIYCEISRNKRYYDLPAVKNLRPNCVYIIVQPFLMCVSFFYFIFQQNKEEEEFSALLYKYEWKADSRRIYKCVYRHRKLYILLLFGYTTQTMPWFYFLLLV